MDVVSSAIASPTGQTELTPDQKQALARLHQVAQQWEGVFVGMVFKEMRKGESDESIFGEKSNGEKIFSEMLDEQYADQISKTGSLGIAKVLESQMRSAVLADAGHEAKVPVVRGGL